MEQDLSFATNNDEAAKGFWYRSKTDDHEENLNSAE